MIVQLLNTSNNRGELMLVDGGMCRFHVRSDGKITIRDIIVSRAHQRQGIGRRMIATLIRQHPHAFEMRLECPADWEANTFFSRIGFERVRAIQWANGCVTNVWVMNSHDDAWLRLREAK